MKRLILSNSNFYTTKRAQLHTIDTDAKDYHPMSPSKSFKKLPGKEKSRSDKYNVIDDFDIVDSYTDDITQIYAELDTYQGSIVEPVANSIKSRLHYYSSGDRYLASDELRVVDTLIIAASNLDILEDACLAFEDKTGCMVHVYNSPSVCVRYQTFLGEVMTPKQVWTALSGQYSASQIVNSIMMPKHKINIREHGEPTETL